MSRIIHALPTSHRSRMWIVRTDGVADVTLKGEERALEYARLVAQRLADRLGKPVVLRIWNVLARYRDELHHPSPDPLRDPLRRRKAA